MAQALNPKDLTAPDCSINFSTGNHLSGEELIAIEYIATVSLTVGQT